jgi:hypothetical protein
LLFVWGALAATGLWVVLAIIVAPRVAKHILLRFERDLGRHPRSGFWEMLYGFSGGGLRTLALTAQRAETGRPALAPMEPPLARSWLSDLRWNPRTLTTPIRRDTRPSLETSLGPYARRPLTLAFPVLLSGMGWGVGVTTAVRHALAEAAQLTGVALNSGEGPVYPAEPHIAPRWVWQWSRANWRGQTGWAPAAAMVEIQVGQASEGSLPITKRRSRLPRSVRRYLPPHRALTIRGVLPAPLAVWIRRARRLGQGVPVAVKIPAAQQVEHDVAHLLAAGADVITLDGAGAGTAGSPAVITDHLGLPVAVAVARAHRWLLRQGLRDRVSLVASGHVHSAAELAMLLALGADAVAVGSVALVALAHGQVSRVLPQHGPGALVLAGPKAEALALDGDLAAERLAAWLTATRHELALLCVGAGVPDVTLLGSRHVVAETPDAARLLGLSWYGRADAEDPTQPGRILADLLLAAVIQYRRGLHVWETLANGWAAVSRAGPRSVQGSRRPTPPKPVSARRGHVARRTEAPL